jgi:outer membrane immunogenic protein
LKKYLLIAASVLFAASAFAADKPVKKPIYTKAPPAPIYLWTGFYVGGNVGYGWGDANTDVTGNANVTASIRNGPSFPASFAFGGPNSIKLNRVIGGGQIGYNYQFSSNGVAGFEADFQGPGERGSGQFTDPFAVQFPFLSTINGAASPSYQASIDWFGTVRGRLGILVGDQLLIYGTGGLAYGRVAVSGNTALGATFFTPFGGVFPFSPATPAFVASKTNVGFSVGGGMEGRLSYWLPPNWTWKLEYLYLDLGSLDTATSFALAPPPILVSAITGTITTHTHFTDNIVRIGLNYRFGNYYVP